MDSNEGNSINSQGHQTGDWNDEQAIDIVAGENGSPESVDDDSFDSSELARRGLDLIRIVVASAGPGLVELEAAETPRLNETPLESIGVSGRAVGDTGRGPILRETPGRIGRFEIVRELGRGGFGVVLLARDPILERMVALKIPRIETFGSPSARGRFEREARAAAMLAHPRIVPLFETQLDGPFQYIAFGFVPGESLAEFLARIDEPIAVRLAAKIVASLAEAVEHAHQRGVIHRDLKPNNVLINNPKANGRLNESEIVESLCIADFGLAKVAGTEEGNAITREGAILGTPSYMSPEQATGRDTKVGPASDIWSLGAILYELLTGWPPFKGESDLATLRAVERDTPRSPRAINSLVTADLQAICLKCLEKKPADRYAHAGDLAADLNRWLNGMPVAVRPVCATGRLWRWTCRNPALAGALGLAFVALTVGLSVALVQQNLLRNRLLDITLEKKRADEQSVAAQTQSEIARSVRDFLFDDLLNQADESFQIANMDRARALGLGNLQYVANPTINDLAQRVLPRLEPEQLEKRFPGQPLVQAELLMTVARLLKNQRLFQAALPLVERAMSIYQLNTDEKGDRTLDSQYLKAVILSGLGKVKESRELHENVLALRKKTDVAGRGVVRSLHATAAADIRLGDREKGLDLLKQALQLELEQHDVSHPKVRTAVNVLAHHYLSNRTPDLARAILIEHYPEIGNGFSLEDGSLSTNLEFLDSVEYFAECESSRGNADHAIELLEQAASARESLFGEFQSSTIMSRLLLAKALTQAKRFDESISTQLSILEIIDREFGTESNEANVCSNNLANAYWSCGKFEEAIPLQRELFAAHAEKYGPERPVTLIFMANLACSLRDAGQHDEAVAMLKTVVEKGRGDPALKWVAHELIWAYERAGDLDAAETYCRSWLNVIREEKNPQAYWMAKPLTSLGRVLYAKGERAEAETVFREVLETIESGKMPNAAKTWTCQESVVLLGACLLDQEKFDEAGPMLESGCRNLELNLPPPAFHQNVATCYRNLIRYYEQTNQPDLVTEWTEKLATLENQP